MILADTSAWVEYDRATGSAVDTRLTQLIADELPLAVTEPVIMEVLAGARTDARERDLHRLLLRFELHVIDPAPDFEAAARIYRPMPQEQRHTARPHRLRLITAVAWRRGAILLAFDVDLHRVADVIGVEMDPASDRG